MWCWKLVVTTSIYLTQILISALHHKMAPLNEVQLRKRILIEYRNGTLPAQAFTNIVSLSYHNKLTLAKIKYWYRQFTKGNYSISTKKSTNHQYLNLATQHSIMEPESLEKLCWFNMLRGKTLYESKPSQKYGSILSDKIGMKCLFEEQLNDKDGNIKIEEQVSESTR